MVNKYTTMHFNYHDIASWVGSSGLFLFTGADLIAPESAIIQLISKVGIAAVLWFWLRDLRKQMQEQLASFEKESAELKTFYGKTLEEKEKEYKDYKDRLEKILAEKDVTIHKLQDRIMGDKD